MSELSWSYDVVRHSLTHRMDGRVHAMGQAISGPSVHAMGQATPAVTTYDVGFSRDFSLQDP